MCAKLADPTPRMSFLGQSTYDIMREEFQPQVENLFATYQKRAPRMSSKRGRLDDEEEVAVDSALKRASPPGAHTCLVPPLSGLERISALNSARGGMLESSRQTLREVGVYFCGERSVPGSLSFVQVCYNCLLSMVRVVLYSSFIVNVVLMLDALEKERRLLVYAMPV
eukprot:Gregarina_sp_Pseudo_9__665@NODE_1423_length_1614_cov_207_309841_g1321_i0_p1_GENE_NODE_1423_length_1614_cov_207_309841_g1321_i0NODE_1423_length_1614_cov_207_309841_g1321_i0_p1_ORF_typecomplete_len168_score27_57DUF384/PF04064_13/4_4e03DUF384/PF04064_13/0_53_NODE_1423_length_1614_cov_207_309841_g1321_i093596